MNSSKDFLKEGILVEPELAEYLRKAKVSLVNIVKNIGITFLSKKDFFTNLEKILLILENLKEKSENKSDFDETISYLSTFMDRKKGQAEEKEEKTKEAEEIGRKTKKIRVLNNWRIPSRKISVEDFVKYFRSRFIELKSILQGHNGLPDLTSINKISSQKQSLSLIGIVTSKRTTKNKNIILELEDLTGRISVLVHNSKQELVKKANEILLDEVIGIRCNGNSEILFANDIIFPEIAVVERKNRLEDEYAVFTSDIHLGSKKFIEDKFLHFIKWLNGEVGTEEQKKLSKKIKYLFFIGDNVDGVGIFPGQEELLEIKDLSEQYKKLAEYLGRIKKDITMIMLPGQHDAVRVAEPQPEISKDFAAPLYSLENLILVSNPAFVEIGGKKDGEGLKVLLYHGASFHSFVDEIEELRFGNAHDSPTKIIKFVLKKRHLAPSHSSTTHIPVPEADPLLIREVPDVIATGDLHKADVDIHNKILMIASSCWQSITPFEEKVGNHPDPCKVPILNLKTRKVNIIDFS